MTIYLDDNCVGAEISIDDAYRRLNYNGAPHIILYWLPSIESIRIYQTPNVLAVTFHNGEVCTISGSQYPYETKLLKACAIEKLNDFGGERDDG